MKPKILCVFTVVGRSKLIKNYVFQSVPKLQNFWEILGIESYLFYIPEKMKTSRRNVFIDQIHVFESLAKPLKISENIEHKK